MIGLKDEKQKWGCLLQRPQSKGADIESHKLKEVFISNSMQISGRAF